MTTPLSIRSCSKTARVAAARRWPSVPTYWEISKVLREIDERGEAAVAAAAHVLSLPQARVRAAMHYYGDYSDEIDAEIAEADRSSAAAEQAWRSEQRLLA